MLMIHTENVGSVNYKWLQLSMAMQRCTRQLCLISFGESFETITIFTVLIATRQSKLPCKCNAD